MKMTRIEGNPQQVIAFLDRLTYGVCSGSEREQIRTQWKEGVRRMRQSRE